MREYTDAINMNPKLAEAYVGRAEAYIGSGLSVPRALSDAETALRLDSKMAHAYALRATCEYAFARFTECRHDCNEALKLNPKDAQALTMHGWLAKRAADYRKAIADFKEAIRLQPGRVGAYTGLATVLATCPDAHFRNGKAAIDYAKKVAELAGANAPGVSRQLLADAYAESGDFPKAIQLQEALLDDPIWATSDAAHQRLQLFQNHRAYHEPLPARPANPEGRRRGRT